MHDGQRGPAPCLVVRKAAREDNKRLAVAEGVINEQTNESNSETILWMDMYDTRHAPGTINR